MDEDPGWLDDEEQQVWLQLSLLMTRLPAALERQLQRDAGLSLYEYLLLSGLSMAHEQRLRLRDLAEFTGTSLSRLSNVIRKLEGHGWVSRVPDPLDGRSTFAVLSEAGYAKVVASAPGHVREVRKLVLDPLSAGQLRRFGSAIRQVLDVVDPDGCDPNSLLYPDGGGSDDRRRRDAGVAPRHHHATSHGAGAEPATTASTASP